MQRIECLGRVTKTTRKNSIDGLVCLTFGHGDVTQCHYFFIALWFVLRSPRSHAHLIEQCGWVLTCPLRTSNCRNSLPCFFHHEPLLRQFVRYSRPPTPKHDEIVIVWKISLATTSEYLFIGQIRMHGIEMCTILKGPPAAHEFHAAYTVNWQEGLWSETPQIRGSSGDKHPEHASKVNRQQLRSTPAQY